MSGALIEALAVTAELIGMELSKPAAKILLEDLSHYPEASILQALGRCRKELRGRLTIAEILDRLPDGHPGPEEAWSCVSRGMQNEALTVVWTDQMREAYGVAVGLADDPVAARMAFKEAYTKLVHQSRANGESPSWSVSKGTDKHDQERAILEGVKAGRLQLGYAQKLLPHSEAISEQVRRLLPGMRALS